MNNCVLNWFGTQFASPILSGMLKTSYSSVVYCWHLLFMCIHDSSPVESCIPPVKCCLISRGTEFGKAQCKISASDPTGMNAILQKGIDCLTTCLKDSRCQTYEYTATNCWLGINSFPDCLAFLVNCILNHSSLFRVQICNIWVFVILRNSFTRFCLLKHSSFVRGLVRFLFALVFVLSFFSSFFRS